MTKTKKRLIYAFLFIVISGLLLQIDDELDPGAEEMLGSIKWNTPNDAYLYLLGFSAPLGSDPIEVGKRMLKEIRSIEARYEVRENDDNLFFKNQGRSIDLQHCSAFCNARELGCLESLFLDNQLSLVAPEVVEIKRRYLKFINMTGYRTQTIPHIFEPFPKYSNIVKGNRIVSLSAIEKAKGGDPNIAVSELYRLIEAQKRFLTEVDNLIGKTIAYVLLNETIDVLSLILREYQVKATSIELLTYEQLSIDGLVNREFAFVKSSLTLGDLDAEYHYLPSWVIRLVFKPNMTINAALPVYDNAKRLSKLPMHEFAEIAKQTKTLSLEASWVRNAIGSTLNQIAQINLKPYIAHGFDLNAKLTLFNSVLDQRLLESTRLSIDNPYYNVQQEVEFIKEANKFCLQGPLEDPRFFRCLTVLK